MTPGRFRFTALPAEFLKLEGNDTVRLILHEESIFPVSLFERPSQAYEFAHSMSRHVDPIWVLRISMPSSVIEESEPAAALLAGKLKKQLAETGGTLCKIGEAP